MLDIAIHKSFAKELKNAKLNAKLNASNTAKLFMYISVILNKHTLPSESLDHALQGEYKDTREFHISRDLLVIYRIHGETLELLRIGTHSQLFK